MNPLIIISSILVGAFLTCCGSLWFLKQDMCGYNELQRVSSENGELDAVLVTYDCGATTGFTHIVSVVPQGGNDYSHVAFSADKVYKPEEFDLSWRNGTVFITLPKDYREGVGEKSVDLGWGRSVKVEYQ